MDREQYEEELKRRQQEHLSRIRGREDAEWQPCLHDSCQQCHGTGIKLDGSSCIHNIACQCQKCSPRCSVALDPCGVVEPLWTHAFGLKIINDPSSGIHVEA